MDKKRCENCTLTGDAIKTCSLADDSLEQCVGGRLSLIPNSPPKPDPNKDEDKDDNFPNPSNGVSM